MEKVQKEQRRRKLGQHASQKLEKKSISRNRKASQCCILITKVSSRRLLLIFFRGQKKQVKLGQVKMNRWSSGSSNRGVAHFSSTLLQTATVKSGEGKGAQAWRRQREEAISRQGSTTKSREVGVMGRLELTI